MVWTFAICLKSIAVSGIGGQGIQPWAGCVVIMVSPEKTEVNHR